MAEMHQTLTRLVERPDVAGALVFSEEGLTIASALPPALDPEATAAHAATIWRGIAILSEVTATGTPAELVLEGTAGVIILHRLGPGVMLFVLAAGPDAPLGDLLHDLRRHAPALLAGA